MLRAAINRRGNRSPANSSPLTAKSPQHRNTATHSPTHNRESIALRKFVGASFGRMKLFNATYHF